LDIGAGDKKRIPFYESMTEAEQERDKASEEPFKYWNDDSHNSVSIMRA